MKRAPLGSAVVRGPCRIGGLPGPMGRRNAASNAVDGGSLGEQGPDSGDRLAVWKAGPSRVQAMIMAARAWRRAHGVPGMPRAAYDVTGHPVRRCWLVA